MTGNRTLTYCAAFLTFLLVGLLCKSSVSALTEAEKLPDSRPSEKTATQQQETLPPISNSGNSTANAQANSQGKASVQESQKNSSGPKQSQSNNIDNATGSLKSERDLSSADRPQLVPPKEVSNSEGFNGGDLQPSKQVQDKIATAQDSVRASKLKQMETPLSEHIQIVLLLVLGVILLFLVWKVFKRLLSIKPDQNMKSDAGLEGQTPAQTAPLDLPEVDNETLKQIIDPIREYLDQRFKHLEHSSNVANNGQTKQVAEFIKQEIQVCLKENLSSFKKIIHDAAQKHDSVIQKLEAISQALHMQAEKNEEKDKQIALLTENFQSKKNIETLRYFCRTLCSYREKIKEYPENAAYLSICKKLEGNLQRCDVEEFEPDKKKRYHELKDDVQDSPEEQITNNKEEDGYIAEVIEQGFRFSMEPKNILGARVRVYRYEEPRE